MKTTITAKVTRAEALRRIRDPLSDLNEVERTVLKWQLEDHGDFYTNLWKTLALADEDNLDKLRVGFPREVAALIAWRTTWVGESLRQRGYPI